MRYTKLSVVIAIGGGSPFPPYERVMAPIIAADFGVNFASVFTPAAIGTRTLNQSEVFAILDAHPQPAHWATIVPTERGFPQWGLRYSGPGVTSKGIAAINCYFGIATSNVAPPPLRQLYVLDLPLFTTDDPPLAKYGDEMSAWFTLYVYQNWQVRLHMSHEVDAQFGLHGEVTGVNLA